MSLDIAQLKAMLEALEADEDSATPDNPPIKARQFSSLGFVVVGEGTKPDTGTTISVPTKAGKVAHVRVLEEIDTSPFNGEFGEWAFTYKRLKRGES